MSERITRKERRKQNIRKKIRIGIIVLLFFIGVYAGVGIYKENRVPLVEEGKVPEQEITIEQTKLVVPIGIEKIPETYLEYEVIAKLEVPKIKLDTNVLKQYNSEGMKVCASKFWGPEPNEIGNFCIAGHNYEKENMFNHLIDLEIGDELYLTDNKNGKIAYTICNIYKVKPQNTAPINQETNGNRMVTLITCVNYSQNRLIVQAIENKEGNRSNEAD